MTVHVHQLAGCTPTPLAGYLKALAVIRLLGTQPDPGARALWRDDAFVLFTHLDQAALRAFFLRHYQPTPLVAPWNGGSGFYPKDNKDGIDAIAAGASPRFAPYRRIIALARELTQGRDSAPKEEEKAALIRAMRGRLRGPGAEWLDAALVLVGDAVRYPALLGTGGNDGRLDFTNNQMQRLTELLSPATGEPLPHAESLLDAALWAVPASGLVQNKPIGQFLPGAAGGANSTTGPDGDSLINPWDFVLMLEGAALLQVAAVRRLDSDELPQAAAPFAVRPQAAGYPSASGVDESARGEQWMPLWSAPATLAEIRSLFAEGRLQSGPRRARRAVDAARAVARLGAARGVTELVRFGFIERNGQANLAVPLGRWQVQHEPALGLLDDIDRWVDRLRMRGTSKTAPASLERDFRTIERAMLAVCREGERAERWQELLMALGQAEDNLVRRGKSTAAMGLQPLPELAPGWLHAAGDDSAELRLAAAIASQRAGSGQGTDKASRELGSIRAHCLPLDAGGRRFAGTAEDLKHDPRVVWTGRDLVADLGAVAMRRLQDGQRAGISGLELRGRIFAGLDDIQQFLLGTMDDARIAALARGLMAVAWRRRGDAALPRAGELGVPMPAHALFRLLYMPAGRRGGSELQPVSDPLPLRLLLAGRLDDAVRHALRRTIATGGRPKLRFLAGSGTLARRLAASLCIPVSWADQERLRRALLRADPTEPAPAPLVPTNQIAD